MVNAQRASRTRSSGGWAEVPLVHHLERAPDPFCLAVHLDLGVLISSAASGPRLASPEEVTISCVPPLVEQVADRASAWCGPNGTTIALEASSTLGSRI